MIKAVVFDVGGVLLTGSDWEGGVKRLETARGLAPGTLARAAREAGAELGVAMTLGKAVPDDFHRAVAAHAGVGFEDILGLIDDVTSTEVFDPEWKRFIFELRPRYKTATLTNAWLSMREILTKRGVAAVMDELFISAELGMAKPQPEIFLHVVDSLGVGPDEILFVDDLEENIGAAATVGIVSVLHQNTKDSIARLQNVLAEDALGGSQIVR